MSAAAATASAAHIGIDFAAGVYPPDLIGIALVGLPASALYALWFAALVRVHRGDGAAARAAAMLSLWQAGVANGLAALFPCPPTVLFGGTASCEFAPWQDLVHIASLTLGFAAYGMLRARRTGTDLLTSAAVALLVVHLALSVVVALQ